MVSVTLDTSTLGSLLSEPRKRASLERLFDAVGQRRVDLLLSQPFGNADLRDSLTSLVRLQPVLDTTDFQHLMANAEGFVPGEDTFLDYFSQAKEIAQARGSVLLPEVADWLSLHIHSLQGRDFFLTWSKPLLLVAPEVGAEFKIRIITPDTFLKFGEY